MNDIQTQPQSPDDYPEEEMKADLYDAFLDNYKCFLADPKSRHWPERNPLDVNFKMFSSPGPSQYQAFEKLFSFIDNAPAFFKSMTWKMSCTDLARATPNSAPLLDFLKSLHKYGVAGKRLTLNLGVLWNNSLADFKGRTLKDKYREKLTIILDSLHSEGADIHWTTAAPKSDFCQYFLSEKVTEKARFGIGMGYPSYKGFPLCFAKLADERLFITFPHTESSCFRLYAALDMDGLPYARGKDKNQLSTFLDNMADYGMPKLPKRLITHAMQKMMGAAMLVR